MTREHDPKILSPSEKLDRTMRRLDAESKRLREAATGAAGYLDWLYRHGDDNAGRYASGIHAALEDFDA